jgi:hypothetical protein
MKMTYFKILLLKLLIKIWNKVSIDFILNTLIYLGGSFALSTIMVANMSYAVIEQDNPKNEFNVDKSNEEFIILERHKEIDGVDVIIEIDSCKKLMK